MNLGKFKAGTIIFYGYNFQNDIGTIENPTSPEAQIRTPSGVLEDLITPAIQNAKTGHYGGTIDTTGFAVGQYIIRIAGGVSTAKIVATEFTFMIESNDHADIKSELTIIVGYIDTEVTTIINAIGNLQSDLGDPSVDVTTIYTQLLLIKGYIDEIETRLTSTRAGYIDNLSGGAVALNSTVAKEATLTNATYGLLAIKTLIEAIDISAELTSQLDEIKGIGWTNETLHSIKDAIVTGRIIVPVMEGEVYTATIIQKREVTIVRGDTPLLIFNLGDDYSTWIPKFGAKEELEDTEYVMSIRSAVWIDASIGHGQVQLATTDTATAGKFYGEIELRNGDERLTGIKFTIRIIEDVIK